MRWQHPIYNPLGLGNTANNLEAEYRAHPRLRRLKWLKQWVRLKTLLFLSGQYRHFVQHLPTGTRKVLYVYDWGAIGDSIMDLSQRQLFPDEIQLDLYMPAKAAELFEGDKRFKNIYRNAVDCPLDYDLVILHNISPALLKFKTQYYASAPFYDVLGFIQGELYDRAFFCHVSLSGFLEQPSASLCRSQLGKRHVQSVSVRPNTVLVAMGALDQERRRYKQWSILLAQLQVVAMQKFRTRLTFVLTGLGASAREDVDTLSQQFIQEHCEIYLDLPSFPEVQAKIATCQYFLGPDGGLMHIAEAMNKQGVALFAQINPNWRLVEKSRLCPLFNASTVNDITPIEIVAQFEKVLESAGVQ